MSDSANTFMIFCPDKFPAVPGLLTWLKACGEEYKLLFCTSRRNIIELVIMVEKYFGAVSAVRDAIVDWNLDVF